MTKEEAAEVMAVMKAAYPGSFLNMTRQEAMGVVSVWALQFADMPADIVHMALQKAISCCRYPPTVSEVKAKMNDLYWEAWEQLNRDLVILAPEERCALARICEETSDRKESNCHGPEIGRMLPAHTQAGGQDALPGEYSYLTKGAMEQ